MSTGVDFDSVGTQPKTQAKPQGIDYDAVGAGTAHPSEGVDFDSVATHGHQYSFAQLKDLWTKAGGDPKYADIMAHVALAESGDGKQYAYANSNADGKTSYQENGKTYYPRGLWQISTVHGDKNWLDPMTNAKEAVALFKSNGFEPWEASRHGGAGGGWGQYAGQHFDPGESQAKKEPWPKKLPPGGMPAVLGSTFHTPITQQAYSDFLTDVADKMEGVIKNVSDFGWSAVQSVKMGQQMAQTDYGRYPERAQLAGFGLPQTPQPPKRLSQAIQGRLSPVLRQAFEAGDAPFEAANAALRAASGDRSAWDVFNHSYSNPSEMLDAMGPLMANSPSDIAYWSKKPGLVQALMDAKPTTVWGQMAQLALGMHADLARIKPGHPYLTGTETTALELGNPAWIALGKFGAAGTHGLFTELQAARAGTYGPRMAGLAKALADAPMLGNRFWRMGDASGIAGENYHALWARNMSGVYPEAMDTFTSADTYGGLNREQQINVQHVIEHPVQQVDPMGMPTQRNPKFDKLAQQKVGGMSYAERAGNKVERTKMTENDLRAVAPEQAKKLLQGDYASHVGAWKTQLPEAPGVSRGGGAGQPFNTGRLVPTLDDGLQRGLEMDEGYLPAAAEVLHEARMRQYITWMRGLRGLSELPMNDGTMHAFNINYQAPLDAPAFDEAVRTGSAYTGPLQALGEGRVGSKAMLAGADKYAQKRGVQRMAQEGLDESYLPKLTASARSAYIARVRKIFSDKYPNHVFDAADFLGAPDLKGTAVSKAGVDAAIDVHPGLSKMYGARAKDFESWMRDNPADVQKYLSDPTAAAAHDEIPEATTPGYRYLDLINGAIRQGQVLGAGYHGIFNLAPNALTRLPFRWWPKIATALGINRLDDIPQAWLDDLDASGAVQKGVGGVGGIPTKELAKVLTVPYRDFVKPAMASKYDELLGKLPASERPMEPDWAARAEKAYTQLSRWSQGIAFHYQERRIAAVLYHYLQTGEKLSPDAAAREVSKLLNDSHNLTRGLEREHIRHWAYFYGWVRRGLRLAARTAVEEPRKIAAPLRGVQTANDLQGDEGSAAGTGLSMRAAGDAIEKLTGIKGLGTDAQGNPRYVDIPSFWSFGSTLARFLGSGGNVFGEGGQVIAQRAASNLTPVAGTPIRMFETLRGDAEMPAPYNDALWDKDAPTTATKFLQFAKSVSEQYAPTPFRGPTLGMGPTVFTEPNTSKITKAQYGALQDMRRALVGANKAGDHDLAQQIYEQMELVNSGDANALSLARGNIARWNGVLGIRGFQRRGRYVPRF